MVIPHWLAVTKGYGITVSDIDESCPAELEPYEKAYEKSYEFEDYKAWIHGRYVYEAFAVVLSNAFSKRGAQKVEYPQEPYTMQVETREMTKEEFEALPPEEQERIAMMMWDNAMGGTVAGFNRMKDEGGKDG